MKISSEHNNPIVPSKIERGTILIPDISGFSEFVRNTEIHIGQYVIASLLRTLVQSNKLNMEPIEIEGDAILFYKKGVKIPPQAILNHYQNILKNFNRELSRLEKDLEMSLNLSVKMIAHYGKVTRYKIGKFYRIYGQSLLEAHQLLKNGIPSSTYCLITDTLTSKKKTPITEGTARYRGTTKCELYGSFVSLCYTYYDFERPNLQIESISLSEA